MPDDVLLNELAIVERCLARIEEEYRGREDELVTNQTRQDAIILNLQRACEAAIDLAMHLVRDTDSVCPNTAATPSSCSTTPTSWIHG